MAEYLPKSFLLSLALGIAVTSCGTQLPVQDPEGSEGENGVHVDGSIVIENGAATAKSLVVQLTLTASSDATLMQISESSIFENESWENFKSSKQYTFDSEGQKKLYAKFSNRYGLESSPFSATITINLAPTADDLFTPRQLKATFDRDKQYNNTQTVTTIGSKIYAWAIRTDDAACQTRVNMQWPDAGCAAAGSYYDTSTDAGWTRIANAPLSTVGFSAIAGAGNKLIAWGGFKGWVGQNYPTGTSAADQFLGLQIYDPSTDSWSTSTASGALSPRASSVVVSTGSTVIIWGGVDERGPAALTNIKDAAEYNPTTDTWTSIPYGPFSSRDAYAQWKDIGVWTGKELYVFSRGGTQCYSNSCDTSADGEVAVYNKASNQWRKLSTKIYPNNVVYNDGYIYFPDEKKKLSTSDDSVTDWTPLADTPAGSNVYTTLNGLLYSHTLFTIMPFNAKVP